MAGQWNADFATMQSSITSTTSTSQSNRERPSSGTGPYLMLGKDFQRSWTSVKFMTLFSKQPAFTPRNHLQHRQLLLSSLTVRSTASTRLPDPQ